MDAEEEEKKKSEEEKKKEGEAGKAGEGAKEEGKMEGGHREATNS